LQLLIRLFALPAPRSAAANPVCMLDAVGRDTLVLMPLCSARVPKGPA